MQRDAQVRSDAKQLKQSRLSKQPAVSSAVSTGYGRRRNISQLRIDTPSMISMIVISQPHHYNIENPHR